MDSLKEVWNNTSVSEMKLDIDTKLLKKTLHARSKGVVEKLNQRLNLKLWYIVSNIVLFGAVIIISTSSLAQLLSAIVLVVLLLSAYLLYKEKQVIQLEIFMERDLKSTLITYKSKVERILKLEQRIGLLIYPFCIVIGYILGFTLFKEHPVAPDRTDYIVLTICTLLFFPVAHYLTKWMNRIAFGKYLNQLSANIENLEK